MTEKALLLVSHDRELIAHWERALGHKHATSLDSFSALKECAQAPSATVWLDLSLPGLPGWSDPNWQVLLGAQAPGALVAADSTPHDARAMAALDAGCAGYCHAFADAQTLGQVNEVVQAGQIWVGRHLMQRLLAGARLAKAPPKAPTTESTSDWGIDLTAREREIALQAANGASNLIIAENCGISERTVKAHLGAVFTKLNIADRLQLALRVHGIS